MYIRLVTPNLDLAERLRNDQLKFENFLPEELKELYYPGRTMSYFKAYEKLGTLNLHNYDVVSGLSFMAVVFEIAGKIHPVSSNPTSDYFKTCMDVAKKLSEYLLEKANMGLSKRTDLVMLFVALAYQTKPVI